MDKQRATLRALSAPGTDATAEGPPRLDAGFFAPESRRRLSGPGLRGFLAIAERWGLTERERLLVLGLPGRSTYHGWIAKARAGGAITLPLDTLLRISAVLGIHKGLEILFPREGDALAWLRAANAGPVFGGQAPLALVVGGTQDGILQVRRYLDAWRGGRFAAPRPGLDEQAPPLGDEAVVFV